MVEPKTTADGADEYEQKWNEYVEQLYKLGHSLPDDELEDFLETVDELKEYIEVAAENTYQDE